MSGIELLKLLLVDDEKIILQGLQETYEWESMGYEVVGAASSGEEALALLEDEEPDVVITDVRMKRISGLELIERTKLTKPDIEFVVVSAYKDFTYAKKACEEGALAYLVKPIDDDELERVMKKAYQLCMDRKRKEKKYESFQRILAGNSSDFMNQMLERYVKDMITESELRILAEGLAEDIGVHQYFCGISLDLDIAYRVTNQIEFDAKRHLLFLQFEKILQEKYKLWRYEGEDGNSIFIVKLGDCHTTEEIKLVLEQQKKEKKETIISAISNVYVGLGGMKTAYKQVIRLFTIASEAGAGSLTVPKESTAVGTQYFDEIENQVLRALRKNSKEQLKKSFEELVYQLPAEENTAKNYLHQLAVRAEVMLEDSYGVSDNIRLGFANFYSMIHQYTLLKMIDLLYKLLQTVIEERLLVAPPMSEEYFGDYMEKALLYMNQSLAEEELSITTVAEQVFLNPVYFGRLFKNVMGMTFKKYLLNQRMERAKKLLLETSSGVAEIGEKVGIPNPSYFSQLFKQATGKLPSEYKRENGL